MKNTILQIHSQPTSFPTIKFFLLLILIYILMITIIIATSTTLGTYEQNKQNKKYYWIEISFIQRYRRAQCIFQIKNIIYKAVRGTDEWIAILNNAFKNSNLIAFFSLSEVVLFFQFRFLIFRKATLSFWLLFVEKKEQCLCFISKYEKTRIVQL